MPPVLAGAVVFLTSAAVLVLEILAGRLLAPYIGVTLETFTGIIGTILAGISLGSWLGGRAADRWDPRRLIGPFVVAGGVLSLLSPPIIDVFASGLGGADPVSIVFITAMGFFAPAAVLSAVSPTVVKLQLDSLDETGTLVGRLSALGTAGAIVGTFATGFLLIAAAPTRPLVRAVSVLLIVGGLALWAYLHPRRLRAVPPPVALLAVLALAFNTAFGGPCEYESAYFCARVEPDPDNPSGRTLWLDTLRHSYVDLEDPTVLPFSYAQTMSDVLATVAPAGEPIDVLHVGGGGFSLPRYIATVRPGSTSLVLELDPELVRIAREELGLVTSEDLQVRTGDARLTLREVERGASDVVIGDAFGGVAVPWHLTTVEFVESVKARLRPGGTYAINLIDYPPLGFARAEVRTLMEVFEHVAVLAPSDRLVGLDGGNFVLVASDDPIPVEEILARNADRGDDERALHTHGQLSRFVGGATVLTDDHAPVDQLITPLPPGR